MNYVVLSVLFSICLFGGMLCLLEYGRRQGRKHLERDTEKARAGLGAVDGAVFALLGLLVAFTFSGAAARFDVRRNLIVEETNDIGTAWLRIDLLPEAAQPALRDSFRRYVDSRLEVYSKLPDIRAAHDALRRCNDLQNEIWKQATAATQSSAQPAAAMLFLPALNAMFDITTTRTAATMTHPPIEVFGMLGVVAFVSSLLAGYGMAGSRSRSWVHMFSFAASIAVSVYVILDLEFPRLGLIRVDNFDQLLVNLRSSMNPQATEPRN